MLAIYGTRAVAEGADLYLYGVGRNRFSRDNGSSWQPVMQASGGSNPWEGLGYVEELPDFALVDGTLHRVANYSIGGIIHARSEDLGASWSVSKRLDRRRYLAEYRSPFEPARVAVDGESVHVAWDTCVNEGFSNIVDCRIETRSSPDGGRRWYRRIVLEDGSAPVIAAADGLVHLVYQGNGLIYRRSEDGGRTYAKPFQLSTRRDLHFPTGGAFQDLAADGKRIVVAWSSGHRGSASRISGDVFVVVSHDGGESWSGPRLVRRTRGSSQGASIAIESSRLWVAWADIGGKRAGQRSVWFAESADWGRSWGGIRHFRTGIGGPIWYLPSLVADNGRVHLFYPAESTDPRIERLVYRRRTLN